MGKNKKNDNKKLLSDIVGTSQVCYPESLVGGEVQYTRFKPIGFDHTIQAKMTELLHNLVMKYSDLTLAEMGFMHQIAVLFENGQVKVRLYFHPELATYDHVLPNGRQHKVPIPQLGILNGYFFVLTGNPINLSSVTGIEQIMAPKMKIKYDDRGKLALRFKDEDNTLKLQDALYVECNLMIVVAAMLGISLKDPNYDVQVSTISQTGKKDAIMVDGRKNAYQVWVNVQYSADKTIRGYDPDDCVEYLTTMVISAQERRENQKKLMTKAVDEAEKIEKKKKKRDDIYKYL